MGSTAKNLNPSLISKDDFTYKSPSSHEFNEFKTDDHVNPDDCSLNDYISGAARIGSPDSVDLEERLKRYESQYEEYSNL